MRYLTSALLAEGSTDDRFLGPLLERLLVDQAAALPGETQIAPVQITRDHQGPPRVDEVASIMTSEDFEADIVFFHRDCGPRFRRVDEQWFQPLNRALASLGSSRRWVPLCPRRETEAWMLADHRALAAIVGVPADFLEDMPDNGPEIEGTADPKRLLSDAVASKRARRRTSRDSSSYYSALGEAVSLEKLNSLSSFKHLQAAVAAEMARL